MATTKKQSILFRGIKTPLDGLEYLRLLALGDSDIQTIYREAVEGIATVLRPRFESGELRGWLDEDTGGRKKDNPPIWRVESACERYFIRSAEAAVMVVRAASRVARANAVPWKWNDDGGGFGLRTGASSLMAIDVLLEARRQGWSKPRPGETPVQKARRSAA